MQGAVAGTVQVIEVGQKTYLEPGGAYSSHLRATLVGLCALAVLSTRS